MLSQKILIKELLLYVFSKTDMKQ